MLERPTDTVCLQVPAIGADARPGPWLLQCIRVSVMWLLVSALVYIIQIVAGIGGLYTNPPRLRNYLAVHPLVFILIGYLKYRLRAAAIGLEGMLDGRVEPLIFFGTRGHWSGGLLHAYAFSTSLL